MTSKTTTPETSTGSGRVLRRLICGLAGMAVGLSGLGSFAPAAQADSAVVNQVRAVASGVFHNLVVKADGTLWAWGGNSKGQLGDGTKVSKKSPVMIMSDVVTVAAGDQFSLAVKKDGTLWAWGDNWDGQLGDNSMTDRLKPVKVLLDNVASVAAGARHALAVKTDGSLWTWGSNYYGQLGAGMEIGRHKPIKLMDNVKSVAAGSDFSLVLKTNGSLTGFGYNFCGQIGNGTYIDQHWESAVMTGVAAIAAGDEHSLVIKNDRTLWTSGCNGSGQLGNNGTAKTATPMQIMSGVVGVAAGGATSFAVKDDTTLYAWGDNNSGQYGNGTKDPLRAPLRVNGDVSAVSVGSFYSLIVMTDGSLTSTGINYAGQLGDGTTTDRLDPVWIMNIGPRGVTSVKTLATLYLVAGKSVTLPAAVQPYNALVKNVTWKSANTNVAKVDANGKVTAKKAAGKNTTITVTSVDGKYTAKCKVYVVSKSKALKSFKVPASYKTGLGVGKTMQVKPTSKNPAKATGIVPTYSSSDTAVAVIDKMGVITALSPGKATITVKAGGKTKKFVVTVGLIPPTKITLNKKTASVSKGKKITLEVTSWTPAIAIPKTVTWKTSNSKIATVNSSGVVTGKKKGKVTITAWTWNGKSVKCTVTVK